MNKTFQTFTHKTQKLNISYVTSVCPSVCPLSTCLVAAPAGRSSVRCDTRESYKNMRREYKFWLKVWLKSDKLTCSLHEDLSIIILLAAVRNVLLLDNRAKGNHRCISMKTRNTFLLLQNYTQQNNNTNISYCWVSIMTMVSRKLHNVLRTLFILS